MDKLLQTIYKCFYTPKPDEELVQMAETNHRELIKRLSKADRRRVLRIIDAKDAIAERQSIDSFIRGFQLATQLAIELRCYETDLPIVDISSSLIKYAGDHIATANS